MNSMKELNIMYQFPTNTKINTSEPKSEMSVISFARAEMVNTIKDLLSSKLSSNDLLIDSENDEVKRERTIRALAESLEKLLYKTSGSKSDYEKYNDLAVLNAKLKQLVMRLIKRRLRKAYSSKANHVRPAKTAAV